MLSHKRKGIKRKEAKEKLQRKVPPPLHEEEEEEEEDLFMEFNEFWQIVEHHGRVAAFYKAECEQLWTTYTPEQQEAIVRAIDHKLRTGRFVHYNPANAMRDNVPQPSRPKILSYDEYYRTFHTTDAVNGWQKVFLSEQQKTIYVKQ